MKYPKEYLDEIKTRLKVSTVISKFVALKKGDLIFTGTPSGVGKLSKKNIVEIGFSKNKNAEKYLVV